MDTTTHCLPNSFASSLINSGRLSAPELTAILSAPVAKSLPASLTLLTPPPAVIGTKTSREVASQYFSKTVASI